MRLYLVSVVCFNSGVNFLPIQWPNLWNIPRETIVHKQSIYAKQHLENGEMKLNGLHEPMSLKSRVNVTYPNLCGPSDHTCHSTPWAGQIRRSGRLLNKLGKNSQL